MKNSTAYRFIDRDLAGLSEWVIRLAELLALEALFVFAALRTHSWLVWFLVVLLSLAITTHFALGFHRVAKRLVPDEAKRAEEGEYDAATPTSRREMFIAGAILAVIGFVFGVGTSWAVIQIVAANAR